MASLVLTGDTSGQVTLAAAAVAGTNTITVQAATGTMSVNTLATAVASTSGTSIDFTGLPAWIKRITVILSGVSLSGTSNPLIQLGTGSTTFTTSGYSSASTYTNNSANNSLGATATNGCIFFANGTAAAAVSGNITITNVSGNAWVFSGAGYHTSGLTLTTGGIVTLGAVLTAVRITTVNGTDTFDAGTVNILYEG